MNEQDKSKLSIIALVLKSVETEFKQLKYFLINKKTIAS